ncbi:hypothetical protein [Nocardia sp. NBC_01327]|uniref:hypothetical protein n=1 Tax=Nocardia sp. NBC_01327 TaxID=2903593 RepID=UPI002E12ECEC|nr:hypothetical protein OG326_22280 [Nocardia sp. NBC_01327]
MDGKPLKDMQFRFLVDSVFTITGRGTAVIGVIEAGTVSIGDLLRVIKADGKPGPAATCRAIEGVYRAGRNPGDPAPVGLIVPELQKNDLAPGDLLITEVEDR